MSARETKPASVLVVLAPLKGPGNMLGFLPLQNGFSHMRVVAMSPISSLESFRPGHGGKDWGHPIHVFPKAHMVIPLVIYCKRLDP